MAVGTFEDVKVYWATTVASISAPTVANMAASTDLTPFTPTAGPNIAGTTNRASLAMLGDSKIQERIGTESVSPTFTFVKHSSGTDDIAWNLFGYKTKGYLILSYATGEDGKTAGHRVHVFSVESSRPMVIPSAENTLQQFTVEFAADDWDNKAVVAA